MKKIKLLMLSLIAVAFFGCEKDDANVNTVFDNVNGQTLISFASNASNLAVVIGGTGTVDVVVEVSTISPSDRTVTVAIDPESTAATENYTLSSNTVTIPANTYAGVLTINGVDNSVEVDTKTIIINMESTSVESVLGATTHTVNMFQVCPVGSTFMVGDYLLTDNGAENFGIDVLVTISVDPEESTNRTFVTSFLPNTGVARDVDVVITLGCNLFNLNTIDIDVTCDTDNPDIGFLIGNAGTANNSSYDEFVPEPVGFVHTVNYLQDIESDCGPAIITNFTLTKQ